MTVPYAFRLLLLCLASFFLVHLTFGMIVSGIAPAAIRMAERMTSQSAARFLLALRMLPLALAMFVVAGICVPSYLWFEPEGAAEQVGFGCLITAILGACLWAVSITRGLRAAASSARYTRHCRRVGRRTLFRGGRSPVWIVDGAAPFLGLAGIVHPTIIISPDVVSVLSNGQLAAALQHERAHRISHDNLKRLFVLLSPDVFPFFHGFGVLERAWTRFAEWAADDCAVAGDARRSLSLAAALVRVARMGSAAAPSPLVACLIENSSDLSARVDRLLRAAPAAEKSSRTVPVVVVTATLMLACLIAIMLQPATLNSGHELLERLIH